MEQKTDYEVRREQEKLKTEEMAAKLRLVVKALGMEEKPRENDYIGVSYVEGQNAAGEAIFLRCDSYNNWRVSVSGTYPRGREGEYLTVYKQVEKMRSDGTLYKSWDEVKQESITISSDKTPEQIAKDIMRRFMPAYRERLALCVAKLHEQLSYQAQSEITLSTAIGRRLTPNEAKRREYSFYHESGHLGHVKASGKRIDLEISDITAEQAAAIVKIIHKVKKEA